VKPKGVVLVIVLIPILYFVAIKIQGHALVFDLTDHDNFSYKKNGRQVSKGDTLNIFKEFDFENGHWKVYVLLDRDDMSDINLEMDRWYSYCQTDVSILKEMQSQWRFVFTGEDLATVTNQLLLIKDGKLMFRSAIVVDKNSMGLQNEKFGWIESIDSNKMAETLKKFRRDYFPVILR